MAELVFGQRVAVLDVRIVAEAALDARQADMARSAAMRVAQMPSELQRPLVAEALEQYWLFSL